MFCYLMTVILIQIKYRGFRYYGICYVTMCVPWDQCMYGSYKVQEVFVCFLSLVKQQITDTFIQNWNSKLDNSSTALFYLTKSILLDIKHSKI